MDPPKPELTWGEVTDLNFLTYLKILRGRDDVRTQDWTKKPFRDAIRAWIKLQRAREELDTISLEARRVAASIENEEAELTATINLLKPTNPQLAQYIDMSFRHRRNAHIHIRSKLAKLNTRAPYNGQLFQTEIPPNPPPPSSQNEPHSSTHGDIPAPLQCVTRSPTGSHQTHTVLQPTNASHNAPAHPQPGGHIDLLLDNTTHTIEYSEDEQEEDTEEQSYQAIDKLVNVFADFDVA